MDAFSLVLDDVRTMMSITVQFPSMVKCLQSCSTCVAVGCDDGTVGLVSRLSEVTVLGKHTKPVQCLATHGDLLVSADSGGAVKVWSLKGRLELRKIRGSGQAIRAVAFTVNGEFVLAGSDDGLVQLWRVDPWSELPPLRGHSATVSCLLATPDGRYVASGSFDSTVKIWTPADSVEVATLAGHVLDVTCLAAASDSKWLITGGQDALVIVWRLSDMTQAHTFDSHKSGVWKFALTDDNKRLVSASSDCTLKLFDLTSFTEVTTFRGHSKEVNSVLILPNSTEIVSVSNDHSVKVWSLADFQEVTSFAGHQDSVIAVAVSPGGAHVVTGSKDCSVKLWSVDDLCEIRAIPTVHTGPINYISLSPDDRLLVSGSVDNTLQVHSPQLCYQSRTLRGHRNWITALVITCNSQYAISASDDATVKVWDLGTCTEHCSFDGHTKGVNAVIATADSRLVVTASSDKTAKVWDLATKKEVATLTEHSEAVMCLALAVGETKLLTGSFDMSIRVWAMGSFALLGALLGHTSPVLEILVVKDSITVVSRSSDPVIKVWNLPDMYEIVTLHNDAQVSCIAVSPDYQYMVSGAGKVLNVWRPISSRPVGKLYGPTDSITCVQVTQSSQHIAAGALDGMMVVWAYRDLREVARFRAHSAPLRAIAIHSNGRFVSSASDDRTVQCYDLSCQIAALRPRLEEPISSTLCEAGKNSFIASAMQKLREGEAVHVATASRVVLPYYFNSLHVCAYYNHAEVLCQLLTAGVPILRGAFGSVLTVALKRNTLKCVDIMLKHLIALGDSERWRAMQELVDDLPEVIATGSAHIVPFCSQIFSRSMQPQLSTFIFPCEKLPITRLSENWYVQVEEYEDTQSNLQQEAVEFLQSDFRWNFEIGSRQSLELLSALEACDDRKVLTTPLMLTIINWKWEKLMPMTLSLTSLYAALLVSLGCIIFQYGPPEVMKYVFFGLNVFFFSYEGMQSLVNGAEYWQDPWNYLDWVRSSLCMVWVFWLPGYQYVELATVCMCFLRGFTYFRTFKMTRMFVRMTLEVVKQMYSFLVIFAYTIVAFGMMYAVLVPSQVESAFAAWMTAYELLMGTYYTDGFGWLQWTLFTSASLVNVIIMLNLLISILGDAFEHAQTNAKENDTLEQLLIIIEYESMLFWRRNVETSRVLVQCRATESDEDEWKGKVNTAVTVVQGQLRSMEIRLEKEAKEMNARIANATATAQDADRKVAETEVSLKRFGPYDDATDTAVTQRLSALESKFSSISQKLDYLSTKLPIRRSNPK